MDEHGIDRVLDCLNSSYRRLYLSRMRSTISYYFFCSPFFFRFLSCARRVHFLSFVNRQHWSHP